MIGTLYNNIKSISNWTKECVFNENFKVAFLSIITIGAYRYHHAGKQFKLERENFDAEFKRYGERTEMQGDIIKQYVELGQEIRKIKEEVRKQEMELEYIRLINEIREMNKWWFEK
jgi:hypothetical protein